MDSPAFCVQAYGIYDSRIAYPKLTRSAPRCVTRFELELVTESLGGIAYINEKDYPLKRGLFLCGKPGHLRYSQLPTHCCYVHLLTEDPQLQQLLNALPDGCRLSNPAPIAQVFQELITLPEADSLQVGSLVLKLISLLQRMTATELRTDEFLTRSHRAMLQETEVFIRSHLAEELSLERLAHRAKFSASHFHRIFAAYFGKTPHEFILDCRIEAAQAALRSDHNSLIELADSCGFSSQSHFTAQFKKATGQTPLQYRKAMLSRLEP